MTALPDVLLQILDGNLGILPGPIDGIHVKVGACSSGTENQLYSFSDFQTLTDTLGNGPLVEAAAFALATSVQGKGPRPVLAMKITASTAGTTGSVTPNAGNVGTAILAAAGAAYDTYDVIAVITRGGANLAAAVAAFKYSLDGGDTYSQEIAMPTSGVYAIPNTNVTLTFTNGAGTAFVAADSFTFATVAPYYSTTDIQTAVTALLADSTEWSFLHLVGAPGGVDDATKASNLATVAGAFTTHMATFETAGRYVFAMLEGPDTAVPAGDTALKTAFVNYVSSRVMISAGWEEAYSPVNGRVMRRPAAWPAIARIAATPIHEDPGRVASGPITGVTKLWRDERKNELLDAARFTTLRTILGIQGFYVTNGRMMAAAGSDFTYVMNRRVMDVGCRVGRIGLLHYLNESLRVDPKTGYIDEHDARAVEAYVEAQLRAALTAPGSASDVTIEVIRNDNILSTQRLRAKIRIVPLGYAKAITEIISFFNPALAVAA
jgi:hypothetical protein